MSEQTNTDHGQQMCPQARASSWEEEWLSKKPDDTILRQPRQLLDDLPGRIQTAPLLLARQERVSPAALIPNWREKNDVAPKMLDPRRWAKPEVEAGPTGPQDTTKNCLSYVHKAKDR